MAILKKPDGLYTNDVLEEIMQTVNHLPESIKEPLKKECDKYSNEAGILRYIINNAECGVDILDRYDSDITEQFIQIIQTTLMDERWSEIQTSFPHR